MLPAERWKEIAAGPEEDIDLVEAALLIAAHEYPGLDILACQRRVDEMGATLKRRLHWDIGPTETIIALNRYLFDELGFSGNVRDYYDPRNSLLNDVLDRRLGIPITLALVYVEVGRRVGLALHGVSFPGHFLVKCMLRNLKSIYQQRRDLPRALAAADCVIALEPRAADEYRDRAAIYHELECFRAALSDFRNYLMLKPAADDAAVVQRRVVELQQIAARLN